jgi:hypothetical protein
MKHRGKITLVLKEIGAWGHEGSYLGITPKGQVETSLYMAVPAGFGSGTIQHPLLSVGGNSITD